MGEVCGYVFEAPGEKCLYLAADTICCTEVEQTIRKYHPEAIVIASHLNSVNHALLTRKDITAFANKRSLSGIRVPEDVESIVL